jgi:hypothetical protein
MSANWRPGKQPGTVVCDRTADGPELAHHLDYYGGYLVAESIAPENVGPISAALDLLETLEHLLARHVELISSGDCGFWDADKDEAVIPARAALAKAKKQEQP